MTLVIGTHEVEDVAKWVSSPLRQSVFGSKGIKVTTFTNKVTVGVPAVDSLTRGAVICFFFGPHFARRT